MKTIFYIDPQGGSGNLGMYDYELLSRISNQNIFFFGGETYDYLPLPNINSKFWFSYSKYHISVFKGLSYVFTMLRILLMCILKRPSVIHIQWIRLPAFDIKYYTLIKKIFKVKLVYTVHNLLPHDTGNKQFDDYKRVYELSDALIVHTNKAKEELIRDFDIKKSHIFVAPHGPLKYIHDGEEINVEIKRIIHRYNLKGKIIFSLLGNQSEYKGSDLLIEAWENSAILKNNRDIALIIAGNMADKFIKNNQVANIIVLKGFLSDVTFDALIKISDVVLLPYRKIDQSGILLTLISETKPYCATDVGELKVPILKENIGWIIPEISSYAISKTIESIIEHPEEIKKKAANKEGWDRIAKYYDWTKSAKITESIYNGVDA